MNDSREPLRCRHRHFAWAFSAFIAGWSLFFLFTPSWVRLLGVGAIGCCLCVLLSHSWTSGVIRTNWYTIWRRKNPLWFRVEFAVWAIAAMAFVLGLAVVAAGVVSTSVPR